MSKVEAYFKHYRNELHVASFPFYAWKSLNNLAARDKATLAALNKNALSWQFIAHSLQCTFYIALGRIFDTHDDSFSVYKLLRTCIDNIHEFSRSELRDRKVGLGLEPECLEDYMKDVYEPTDEDFQAVRGEVSKWGKVFRNIYQPIRHKIFAHKEIEIIGQSNELFGRTSIGQIQDMLEFLNSVEMFVFELFHNGRKRGLTEFKLTDEERMLGDLESLMTLLKKGVSAQPVMGPGA